MGRIQRLDTATANRIAAGEVVERPASVVKELIENSLDAGADDITVEVADGGVTRIAVSDNGRGMERADLAPALERHATSKIRSIDDLDGLDTLGFRGEALASIAAVSRLRIRTRPVEAVEGHELRSDFGEQPEVSPVGAPPGTRVTVEGLFEAAPARRKHLKSESTEYRWISRVVTTAALGRPQVAFRLEHNGAERFQSPGSGSLKDVLVAAFGARRARQMLPITHRPSPPEEGDGEGHRQPVEQVQGVIGLPRVARTDRSDQYFYINGRPIRSRLLQQAVETPYRHLLTVHRYPTVVIHVTIDAAAVDVNVHPSKRRARFAPARPVRAAVEQAVRQELTEQQLTRRLPLGRGAGAGGGGAGGKAGRRISTREGGGDTGPAGAGDGGSAGDSAAALTRDGDGTKIAPSSPSAFGKGRAPEQLRETTTPYTSSRDGDGRDDGLPSLQPVGQIDDTYIVCLGADGLYIIDQHAAHERVYYEKMLLDYAADGIQSQQLAVPVTAELTPEEWGVWEQHQDLLQDLGFDLEPFGGQTLLLQAVPVLFRQPAGEGFLRQILDAARQREDYGGSDDAEDLAWVRSRLEAEGVQPRRVLSQDHAAVIMGACKAAIKAHDALAQAEAQALTTDLADCHDPMHCPHGRPTVLWIGVGDLEKSFERK